MTERPPGPRIPARLVRLAAFLRRRFTPAGRLALGCLVLSAALGFDTDRSMAYQSFTFLLALLGLSACWGVFFRGRFRASWRLPPFGTVGQPLPCSMTIENLGASLQSGLSAAPEQEDGEDSPARDLPDLPPGASCETAGELLPRRRGKMRLSGVRVAKPDPMGLVLALRRVRAEASVLVLPRRYPVPPLVLPGSRRYQRGGVAAAASVGESQEFVSMRDYRPGDPLRKIHWRSWAKAGKPMVKEYQDEYFVRHALVLDTSGPGGQVFEEAVSVASSFAASTVTQDSLLDLLFIGARSYCFTAGRGLGSPERLLEVLACVEACPGKPLQELRGAVARRAAGLSGCVCVLLGYDEERRDFVRYLRSMGVQALVLAVVPPGAPPFGEADGVVRIEAGSAAQGLAKLI